MLLSGLVLLLTDRSAVSNLWSFLMTDSNSGAYTPPSTPLFDQTSSSLPEPDLGSVDSPGGSAAGKADTAKQEAASVAGDAQEATQHVTSVAKDQASNVIGEATGQARELFGQATSELKEQAGVQQQKAADGLRSISDELSSMASSSENGGLASELVRNLSGRAGSVAGWLDGRDPGSLLDEVKSFAARKPGTFIAIAAGAGILAARLTKALAADAKNDSTPADTVHSPTREPAAGYERTAEPVPVEVVPAASPHDEYADTRSFEDIVAGDVPATRPEGWDR
jgi:hypothetical protein